MPTLTLLQENSFGGDVYSAPMSELETYLDSPDLKFSNTGKRSLLKSMKIPFSYYNKQPNPLQKDMLISAKASSNAGNLVFLKQNDEIVYCTLDKGNISFEDPKEKFVALQNDKWIIRRQDLLYSGVQRYTYISNELIKDEYIATSYIDVPVLYAGKINFEVGLYKVACTNGLLDRVCSSNLKLKPDQFTDSLMNPIVDGIIENVVYNNHQYTAFIDFLKQCPITIDEARGVLNTMIAERILPKNVIDLSIRSFDFVENGKVLAEVLPTEINSMYAFMDTLTYFAQKAPSIGVQGNTEASIFKYFYNKYVEATHRNFNKFEIKSLLPAQIQASTSHPDDFVDDVEEMPIINI